jgi:hypothetical protein
MEAAPYSSGVDGWQAGSLKGHIPRNSLQVQRTGNVFPVNFSADGMDMHGALEVMECNITADRFYVAGTLDSFDTQRAADVIYL